jgi:hypothetical protein
MQTQHLDSAIRRTGRLVLVTELGRSLFTAVAVLATAVVLAIALDVVLALRPAALATVDAVAVTLAATLVAYVVLYTWRQRFNKRRVARLIEERLSITDNRLINAVDLADSGAAPTENTSAGAAPSTSAELRDLSIAQGDAAAAALQPGKAVNRRPMRQALLAALVWVVFIIGFYQVAPGVFKAVVPRYLNPWDDLPPYTLLDFDVKVQPDRVVFGQPASINVALRGPDLPAQANIVFTDGDRKETVPMLRRDDGRFVLHISRAERSRHYYIDTANGRSKRQELTVLPVPLFERVQMTQTPPPYSGWQPATTDLGPEGIRGLFNTEVKLRVKSNVKLRQLDVLFEPAAGAKTDAVKDPTVLTQPRRFTIGARNDDPTVAEGSFALVQTGGYRLQLVGGDGTRSEQTLEGPMVALPDAPPRVRIDEPGMEVIAVENWKVPIRITAEDDVAVSKLLLRRGVNGFPSAGTPLEIDPDRPRLVTGRYVFDLAALGARAGDVITYSATAYDNFPGIVGLTPPGPQFTDTDTFTIRVITEEEYLTYARSKYRMDELVDEMQSLQKQLADLDAARQEMLKELDALKKKIADQGGQLTDEDRKKLKALEDKLADYAKRSQQLADAMQKRADAPQLYDFEADYLKMLKEMAQKMAAQAGQSKDLIDRHQQAQKNDPAHADEHDKKFLDDLAKQLGRDKQGQQSSGQQRQMTEADFRKLQLADRMLGLAEQLVAIAKEQRDLADRLGQIGNRPDLSPEDRQRVDRMAREQAELQRRLEETLKQLETAADDAKDDLPKMSASGKALASKVRDMGIPKDQGDANRLAQAGDHAGAHQSARSAAEKLESLIGQCEGMQGQASSELDGELKLSHGSMANAMQQLAQGRQMPDMQGQSGPSSGFRGAMGSASKAALMGPNTPQGDKKSAMRGNRDGTGRGQGGDPFGAGVAAEQLNPDAAANRAAAGAALLDVPLKWRDLAADYFRRLANEGR